MKSGLLEEWRERPITVAGIGMVAGWMLWLSGVLFVTSERAATVVFSNGPGVMLDARSWAVVFLIAGIVKIIEVFLLRWKSLALAVQFGTMIPLFVWAVSWLWGPATPGQPAYAFVLVIALVIPFVSELINSHIQAKAARVVTLTETNERKSALASSTTEA